ncbi:MAG TPA: Hsp20/alpha crystallin family protein [Solirubrobacteraceae bacterium]|nr:Hsp20/alpha crystallin family protein [Solirubrobacteraceae bacterium]
MADRDLFANFDRVRREMDELFDSVLEHTGLTRRHGRRWPPVDVSYASNPPRAIVTVELGGVRIEDVALQIEGRRLFLAGHRRAPGAGGELFQQVEIERGSFRRLIELGADVDADRITARYEDGMLHVELPVLERSTGRRVVPLSTGPGVPARPEISGGRGASGTAGVSGGRGPAGGRGG